MIKLCFLTLLALSLWVREGLSQSDIVCDYHYCNTGTDCVAIGKRWRLDCVQYRCVKNREEGTAQIKFKMGCPWQDGKCKRLGVKRRMGCDVFKCTQRGDTAGFEKFATKQGCVVGDRCVKAGKDVRIRNSPPCHCAEDGTLQCAVN